MSGGRWPPPDASGRALHPSPAPDPDPGRRDVPTPSPGMGAAVSERPPAGSPARPGWSRLRPCLPRRAGPGRRRPRAAWVPCPASAPGAGVGVASRAAAMAPMASAESSAAGRHSSAQREAASQRLGSTGSRPCSGAAQRPTSPAGGETGSPGDAAAWPRSRGPGNRPPQPARQGMGQGDDVRGPQHPPHGRQQVPPGQPLGDRGHHLRGLGHEPRHRLPPWQAEECRPTAPVPAFDSTSCGQVGAQGGDERREVPTIDGLGALSAGGVDGGGPAHQGLQTLARPCRQAGARGRDPNLAHQHPGAPGRRRPVGPLQGRADGQGPRPRGHAAAAGAPARPGSPRGRRCDWRPPPLSRSAWRWRGWPPP